MSAHYRAYRVTIKPTRTQEEAIQQTFAATRYIWNLCLEQRQMIWDQWVGQYTTTQDRAEAMERVLRQWGQKSTGALGYDNEQRRQITLLKQEEGGEWLQDVPSQALAAVVQNLGRAYKAAIGRIVRGERRAGEGPFGPIRTSEGSSVQAGAAHRAAARGTYPSPR